MFDVKYIDTKVRFCSFFFIISSLCMILLLLLLSLKRWFFKGSLILYEILNTERTLCMIKGFFASQNGSSDCWRIYCIWFYIEPF
ncbi:hypothetical protein AOLI_G00035300 [Acnodon oligacanthus]